VRPPGLSFAPTHLPGETAQEYRDRLQHHEDERRQSRERELVEITSPNNSAATRIRFWERAYHLSMPRGAGHRMLLTIASNTGLTLAEVELEQQLRATRRLGQPAPKVGLIGEG
jgi:hypothetical protein